MGSNYDWRRTTLAVSDKVSLSCPFDYECLLIIADLTSSQLRSLAGLMPISAVSLLLSQVP